MSTPVKPPNGTPSGASSPDESPGAGRVQGRSGEFREQVADASEAGASAPTADSSEASSASRTREVEAELRAGRLDVDQAIDRLVARALEDARHLPPAHRATLEAQLREALSEDPTLVALRRDLERATSR